MYFTITCWQISCCNTKTVAHDMYLIITQGSFLVVTPAAAHDMYLNSDTCQLLIVTWKRKLSGMPCHSAADVPQTDELIHNAREYQEKDGGGWCTTVTTTTEAVYQTAITITQATDFEASCGVYWWW